jgi:hypothetical protein
MPLTGTSFPSTTNNTSGRPLDVALTVLDDFAFVPILQMTSASIMAVHEAMEVGIVLKLWLPNTDSSTQRVRRNKDDLQQLAQSIVEII